jgi:hypothetical protein
MHRLLHRDHPNNWSTSVPMLRGIIAMRHIQDGTGRIHCQSIHAESVPASGIRKREHCVMTTVSLYSSFAAQACMQGRVGANIP